MQLKITDEAAGWFRDEFMLEAGEQLQFYIKIYGGIPTPREGYFLALRPGEEGASSIEAEASDIRFYFNEADKWFLDGYRLEIDLVDEEANYRFIAQDE